MSDPENESIIRQFTRPQTKSKAILPLIINVILGLITIIGITIIFIYIKKVETTINKSTTDASTTKAKILTTSTHSHTTTMNELKFNNWKQNTITVAGGNKQGQSLNQLDHPQGMFINTLKNIFIADFYNHRIVEWKWHAKEGQIIAGGNGQGNRTNQLKYPIDVIFDQQNHSIIIADWGNRRVIRWLNQTQQILIKNIDCWGLARDKYGFLYVTDWKKHEVRRWKMGEFNEGIIVAGGNGEGDELNQLNGPTFIFVDEKQSVYVSDGRNHRVMKWRKDAKEGIIVAGGNGEGENLNQLSSPQGVVVDRLGEIYVVDCWNDRVMRWCKGKEEGEIIVAEHDEGNQSNQLNHPHGLSSDHEGDLYVADYLNHRIKKIRDNFVKPRILL
ncbi:unnamed protein product [Adineta steineri]|uniref:Uncharacterized protein n=1 Tax=Adineta steineri TaxID=433720 RepID=A0A814DH88_9BILA|nr:unnamed protein product [Adineta steineri]